MVSALGVTDFMWGDAVNVFDNAVGGSDTFVFAPYNGLDTIFDLEQGKDHLDLTADATIGIHQFSDLNIEVSGSDSIIHFDSDNQVTIVGVTTLHTTDFLFA